MRAGTALANVFFMSRSARMVRVLGETVREIGILIVVFAPLEAAFTDRAVDVTLLGTSILVGLLLIAGGILVETRE